MHKGKSRTRVCRKNVLRSNERSNGRRIRKQSKVQNLYRSKMRSKATYNRPAYDGSEEAYDDA